MDHNEFDFMIDLIRPFKDFLLRISPTESKGDIAALETQLINLESGMVIVSCDVDETQVEYC